MTQPVVAKSIVLIAEATGLITKQMKKNFNYDKELASYYNMTFQDVVKASDWKGVEKAMLYYYPDQKKALKRYKEIFKEFQTKKAKTDKPLEIELSLVSDVLTADIEERKIPQQYVNVSGRKKRGKYAKVNYGIEFTPWSEILAYPVSRLTQEHYTREEIVAHMLWEITFVGFSEGQVKEASDSLMECVDDIKKQLKEEKKKKKV